MDTNEPVFKLSISCHDQWCLENANASKKEHAFIRSTFTSWIDSPFYKERSKVAAFFQGGYDLKEGWYLVEFWNPDDAVCQKYVDFLNEEFKKFDYEEYSKYIV